MLHRLNLYRIYFSVTLYLLPTLAFALAWLIRTAGLERYSFGELTPSEYVRLLVVVTLIWSGAVHQYRVASVDELFLIWTGLRGIVAASIATHLIVFAVLFFYRGTSFSRIFLAVSAI